MSLSNEIKQLMQNPNFDYTATDHTVNWVLSYQPETFAVATILNTFVGKIPRWAFKKLLALAIRREQGYLNRVIYPAEKTTHPYAELIEKVANHLHCSTSQAEKSIEILIAYGYKPHAMFGLEEPK